VVNPTAECLNNGGNHPMTVAFTDVTPTDTTSPITTRLPGTF
jgi:hypothetical protein